MKQIQNEFDRIAVLSEHDDHAGGIYDDFLLRFVPARCGLTLEVGCGTGSFTRRLASLVEHVTAIDLSSEMIRIARSRSSSHLNIDYCVRDVLDMELAVDRFDCVVTVATLHHLPAEPVLEKLKQTLKPGGTLILHDLLAPEGTVDKLVEPLRLTTSVAARWLRTGRPLPRREIRKAWAEHGKNERYLTRPEVEAMKDNWLCGGDVTYHLLWRYTVVWRQREAD